MMADSAVVVQRTAICWQVVIAWTISGEICQKWLFKGTPISEEVNVLDILYVMDPMTTVSIDKDTTFVFQLEAQRRGHRNFHCLATDLSMQDGRPFARCSRLSVARVRHRPFSLGEPISRSLDSFQCVLMRRDPPFDMAYIFATYLLEAVRNTTFVMNRPQSLRDANEKLFALRFTDLVPPSLVTGHADQIKAFLSEQGGQVVIKPLDGAGGEGVFLLSHGDQNLNAIIEAVTGHGRRYALVQRYIPEIRTHGDKRIIVVDGKPLGATARMPPAGELRGNIHVGGVCVASELTPRDLEICRRLEPEFKNRGLYFVGLDVIGDYLTEVNVTSPTGVQEINALNGVCIEFNVLELIEQRCAAAR